MQMDADLNKIRRRIASYYYHHGLWDILIGVSLVGWGLMFHYNYFNVTGLLSWAGVMLILLIIRWRLQRWLIHSRVGYIEYNEHRRYERILVTVGVVLSLSMVAVFIYYVITLPESYFAGWKVWYREYALLTFGCLVSLKHITIAYWWKVERWYINAVLVFAAFAVYHWLQSPLGFWISGGIMFVVGIILFIRFVQKNPVAAEEGINVSQ